MPAEDQQVARLRAALTDLAAADAGDLLAEARAQARARVRQILSETLVEEMLERLHGELERPRPEPAPAAGTPPRSPTPPPRRATPPARHPAAPAPTPSPPSGEPGWYVYGVIGAETAPAWTLQGVDPAHPVTIVRQACLAAVVSQVAIEDFGEARLREHLADMAWVETTARAHEDVLEQTRAQVTVIPMRMCTVYRNEAGLREMLRREEPALTDALAHLAGKTEMAVKVFAERRRAESALEAEAGMPEAEGAGAGAAYMERRRRERDRAEAVERRLEEFTAEIHERLCSVSADGLVAPPQRPEATGRPGEMILNGVYLVADDALDAFDQEVSALREAFAEPGLELETTGPWPAYNFVPGTIGAAW